MNFYLLLLYFIQEGLHLFIFYRCCFTQWFSLFARQPNIRSLNLPECFRLPADGFFYVRRICCVSTELRTHVQLYTNIRYLSRTKFARNRNIRLKGPFCPIQTECNYAITVARIDSLVICREPLTLYPVVSLRSFTSFKSFSFVACELRRTTHKRLRPGLILPGVRKRCMLSIATTA